jgi:NADH-quinone oxidoreductase subunit G
VLRVLGNLLNLPGFDYVSSDQVTEEVRQQVSETSIAAPKAATRTLQSKLPLSASPADNEVGLYQIDAIVRRAPALQETRDAQRERGKA